MTSHEQARARRLTPGEVAARAGVTVSLLHYYERRGLIASTRTSGNQRRYDRDVLRRLAFVRAARQVGLSLVEVHDALASLPDGRTPGKADWASLSRRWRERLDEQRIRLDRLRDALDECIGCGCLSLQACGLYNHADELGGTGSGAVRWEGSAAR